MHHDIATTAIVCLVRKDMDIDVSEYERLSNNTLGTKIKVKEQHFYCCSTLHSNSKVFNNEHNSYPKMSVKRPLACSWEVLYIDTELL